MLKYRYDLLMLPGCKAGRSQALVKAEGEVKHKYYCLWGETRGSVTCYSNLWFDLVVEMEALNVKDLQD